MIVLRGHRQGDSFQDYKAQLRKEVLNAPATERGVGAAAGLPGPCFRCDVHKIFRAFLNWG